MSRLPLAAWLALLTVGVVLLVAGALAPAAFALLERLAEENARSRVQLAALGAAEAVEREAAAAATAAKLLAERPTLLRLTAAGDASALTDFLERFRQTSRLDGAAVLRDQEIVAASPADLPWSEIHRRAPAGAGFHPPLPGEAVPLATGKAELAGIEGAQALALRRLDPEVAERLSEQMGLPVRIVATAGPGDGDAYHGREPVDDAGVVSVEASLPRSEALRAVAPLRRTFALVTVAACLFAVVAGGLAGRRIAGPLAAMRRAARRIGAGDLATPVTPAAGAEMSALTATLDEMRQRLRSLTDELRHREAEANAILSGVVEGVFAVDGDRRIRYLNQQAAALLGVAAGAAVGRFCGDVLRPVDPGGGDRPCEDRCPIVHARSRGSSRAVEHLELAAGRRTVIITSAPTSGSRQVQVMRDETETEAARRSRDAVVANVSHELKTPLSAQLASIELLRDGLGTLATADAAELVTSLERSTLRLMRLVDNLLESVRIETGQATLRRRPVDLEALVAEAAAMTRPLLEQRRQRLDVAPLAGLPSLTGDPGQLTQVLVNLLANAHKYAPEGSTIHVGAAADAGAVALWVEDAGPGVPPVLSSSIFDRFQRAGGEGQGMGLGLWIAKSIVERHGGRIGVAGSPRGGARFTLTLPAEGERAA